MFVHNIEWFYLIQYDTIQWNVKFLKHTTLPIIRRKSVTKSFYVKIEDKITNDFASIVLLLLLYAL